MDVPSTVKEDSLTEDLRLKQADDKLKEVTSHLGHSRMQYMREKSLNMLLQQQSTGNTALRQLLSLKYVSDQRERLGVEERFIQSQRASYCSKLNRPVVMETFKQTVKEECTRISLWIDSNGSSTVLDQKRIPLIVEERLATAKLKKSEVLKLKRQISRKNSELHKLISDNCRQLLSFLSDYQLDHLAEDTRITLDHFSCKSDALWLKLNVVKLQLMVDTYTPEKTIALKEIRTHLDQYKQQLEVTLVETERSLAHYQSLGPGYMSLAEEYHQIQEEIDNKKWALKELRKTHTNQS